MKKKATTTETKDTEVIVQVRFKRKFISGAGVAVPYLSESYSYRYKGSNVKRGDKVLVNSPITGYTMVEVFDVVPIQRDIRHKAYKYAEPLNS